jgi:hypothetical protein
MRIRRKRRFACRRRSNYRKNKLLRLWERCASALTTCTTLVNNPFSADFSLDSLNRALDILKRDAPLPIDAVIVRNSDFNELQKNVCEAGDIRGIAGIKIIKIDDRWLEPGHIVRLPASFKNPPTSCGNYMLPGMVWENHGFIVGVSAL